MYSTYQQQNTATHHSKLPTYQMDQKPYCAIGRKWKRSEASQSLGSSGKLTEENTQVFLGCGLHLPSPEMSGGAGKKYLSVWYRKQKSPLILNLLGDEHDESSNELSWERVVSLEAAAQLRIKSRNSIFSLSQLHSAVYFWFYFTDLLHANYIEGCYFGYLVIFRMC